MYLCVDSVGVIRVFFGEVLFIQNEERGIGEELSVVFGCTMTNLRYFFVTSAP